MSPPPPPPPPPPPQSQSSSAIDDLPSAGSAATGEGKETSAPFDALIRFEKVSKRFGSLVVLDDLDLAFERGKTTVVLGPSGTGKSVLLKHVVGLIKPDAGAVYFDDTRIDTMRESKLIKARMKMGFLFQLGALFDSMTVAENITFPLKEHTKMKRSEREERGEEVLEMVGLAGIGEKSPEQISGGQRKRVALARAIVLEPDVILYDEPTTGLDPISSDMINELIVGLAERLGITSLVVTHDMRSARHVADRIVMLYNGKLVADATPDELPHIDHPMVQRFVHGEQSYTPPSRGTSSDTSARPNASSEPFAP